MALQKLRSPKIRRLSVVDQVSDSIKQSLLDQVWKEGDKLPSEGELAEYYGVNRLSVRMALQKLSTLGLIETRVGEGSFVAHFSVQPIFSELAPLYDNKEGRRNVEQLRNLLEGVVRIVIFMGYLMLCSHMKDIRRVFQYHGAEHKTIFCYEAGEELTVENVRKQGRFHPRCGTSFMFVLIIIATIVSSIVFSIIDITNPFLRMLAHLILLPLVVGISYEFNRYAGRSESVISRALRWPGLMIQHLTVFEPDDSMIEVAITAMKEVIPDDGSDEW